MIKLALALYYHGPKHPPPGEQMKKVLRCLAVLLIMLPLTAPALCADEPVDGGRIIIGTIGDATSLIPMITSDSSSHEMSGFCYNGLIKYDKDLNIVGDLAESWDISPDGLVITFHLRKGVKFHDGVEYTSRDALFNYKFMIDPQTPTPYGGDYMKVAKAEAPDRYTFRVTYNEPFAPALASWSLSQMPAHLLESKDVRKSPLNRHPIGTGPYKFHRWIPGSRLELVYYDGYFEGRPNLDNVIYRVIPDDSTLFLELKAGGIDWMGLTALKYRRQTDTPFFKKNFSKYKYLASSYTYLGYNLKDPRFQDVRVRRALTHAINKQEIIKGVLLGLGREASGPYKPGTYWYNPNVRKYPYDPAKAKELLAQAGWTDSDGDGWLDKNGERFEFVLLTNQGNKYRENSAVIIQHRLAQIGIKVTPRIIEWAAFLKEFIDKGRFEVVLLAWTMTPDPDLYDVWHSDQIGKLNFTSYKNEELDKLLLEGRVTFDRAKRKAIYDRVQEILAEDQPYTFLYVPDALPVISSRFKGIKPAVSGISYNFIRWWVPKDLQRTTLAQ